MTLRFLTWTASHSNFPDNNFSLPGGIDSSDIRAFRWSAPSSDFNGKEKRNSERCLIYPKAHSQFSPPSGWL